MLNLARATGDADLLIAGHTLACGGYHWAGELTKTVEHADKVLALYDDEKHRHLADILYRDPKTTAGAWGSISTWMLGYPDRALRLSNERDAHARRRGHPFDLGLTMWIGLWEYDHRFTHEDLRKRAEEADQLGRENSLPMLSRIAASWSLGLALIRAGKGVEGIARARAAITGFEATGGGGRYPTIKAFLAEAVAQTGDLDNALRLIDEATARIEHPGLGERVHYPEILRLKGWMLSLKGDLEGAERNFLASLDWARRQQAKMWELRTSASLARLWQSQGKRQDAYELLAPVYGWFTEGFDTKDLLEAKALLDELA
jgi:hypothetical protein